jgi:hypothetical protein
MLTVMCPRLIVVRRRGRLASRRGKRPVEASPGTGAVGGHDSEMIRSARTQAVDVSTDKPVRVPSCTLLGGAEPVAGRRTVLEIKRSGQSIRIKKAVECGRGTFHVRR